ncbi:MAG: glycosyltransferase family 9 protein [Gemmatimonadetes bacterium]|nr:glycosyltransferase family 9 protein [Gemmatimonadota bacterium]
MAAGPRVLIVRFGSLGDVILTTPLLRALRGAHPAATITFVTQRAYAPILDGNPRLDRVVALEPGESLRSLAARLAGDRFDHRLDLHGSLRSRLFRHLVPGAWRGYSKRRAARWRLVWFGGHGASPGAPVAEQYFAAARDLDVLPDGRPAEVFPSGAARRAAQALAPDGFVALAPGARHRTKRWPAAHWRALAERLLAAGRRVVAVGSDGERDLLSGPDVTDGYGLPLDVTAALLARATAAVCNDSGLMHLATAVGTPVVVLLGPTIRAFGFTPYRARAVVLERPLRCRPCSSSGSAFCPLLHHRCLRDIDAATVATHVAEAA